MRKAIVAAMVIALLAPMPASASPPPELHYVVTKGLRNTTVKFPMVRRAKVNHAILRVIVRVVP